MCDGAVSRFLTVAASAYACATACTGGSESPRTRARKVSQLKNCTIAAGVSCSLMYDTSCARAAAANIAGLSHQFGASDATICIAWIARDHIQVLRMSLLVDTMCVILVNVGKLYCFLQAFRQLLVRIMLVRENLLAVIVHPCKTLPRRLVLCRYFIL